MSKRLGFAVPPQYLEDHYPDSDIKPVIHEKWDLLGEQGGMMGIFTALEYYLKIHRPPHLHGEGIFTYSRRYDVRS